jgi:signal transduction histidine kinase
MNLMDAKVVPLIEITVRNKRGEVVPVELNTMLIEYNNEKAVFSVVRDITERKKVEQKILSTVIQTEEKERSHFAKEIHDGVGPLLSASKIYAKALQKADNEEELKYILSKLNETIDEAITSAQEIANNISPHMLQNFGLKGAIESFYHKIGKTSPVGFDFKTNLKERLDINIETTLYRVVVEMINNTIKYAGANSITIELMKENRNISLVYSDDGEGFNLRKTIKESTGMGLSNIESRIKSLDGQIIMSSENQKGFHVEIKINL